MSADPDARQLRSFGHRALLMADRIERLQTALEKIASKKNHKINQNDAIRLSVELDDAVHTAVEALQEQQGE